MSNGSDSIQSGSVGRVFSVAFVFAAVAFVLMLV